jgi:hypothetical protein
MRVIWLFLLAATMGYVLKPLIGRFFGRPCVMQTLLSKKVFPMLSVRRNIYIHFFGVEKQRTTRHVNAKSPAGFQYSNKVGLTLVCLLYLVSAQRLSATLGVAIVGQGAVVVGIDNQISGSRPRLACKMVHAQFIAIIASGTYNFDPSVDNSGYDFWVEASKSLTEAKSVRGVAALLDKKIKPFLKKGLQAHFSLDAAYYNRRYSNSDVTDITVVGIDSDGPRYCTSRYMAETPTQFRLLNGVQCSSSPPGDKAVIVTVPWNSAQMVAQTQEYSYKAGGDITSEKERTIISAIGKSAIAKPGIVSELATIAIIDNKGFRFSNAGTCTQ